MSAVKFCGDRTPHSVHDWWPNHVGEDDPGFICQGPDAPTERGLKPVTVAAAPATGPMVLRTGRRNGHTLYRQLDHAEPSDNDPFLGALGEPEMAARIVETFNLAEAVIEENQRLQRELAEVRLVAAQVEHARAEAQRLQAQAGPLMSDDAKADTEAAYARGLAAGRQNSGGYPNREILLKLAPILSRFEAANGDLVHLVDWLAEGPPPEPCNHEKRVVNDFGDVTCRECGADLRDYEDGGS